MHAGADGAEGHEDVVPCVGEGEELEEGDLVHLLLARPVFVAALRAYHRVHLLF